MRLKDFTYFLLNEEGKPLSGDLNTLVVTEGDYNTLLGVDGKPAFLKKTPDGWRDVLVKFARNNKYWGLFRDFTVPMRFVKDGALIVKDIFWRKGIEGFTKLAIQKADRSIFPIKWKAWYDGELDYSKFKQDKISATVNVMEGGLSKYFKANERTTYEIPVEGVRVQMDGFFLDCTFNYVSFEWLNAGSLHLIPVNFVNGEGTQLSLAHSSEPLIGENVSPGYETTSNSWFLKCFDTDTEIRFLGGIRAVPFATGQTYRIYLRTSTGRSQLLYENLSTPPAINVTIDETFTVLAGENVFLEGQWSGPSSMNYGSSEFQILFKNKYKTTYIKAIRAFDLLNALVLKMSDGLYQAKSDFLTQLQGYVLTSGDAIRGLEGAVIKTSFADFFQSFGRFMVGAGLENNKLAIEHLSYHFKQTDSFDLGIVDAAEITVAEDLMTNRVKVGYENESYEDVNGRFEFNQGQNYTFPLTRVTNEMDLISKYRADPFGIEFTRINFGGKTTTDADSDNDTFFLNIETVLTSDDNGEYYKLNRPADVVITGIPDPVNIFNILLSPKRSLLNNGPLIRSILDHYDDKVVKFQTGEKNVDLVATPTVGEPVIEKADVIIGQLEEKLFLPYYFKFTTSVPVNVQDLLRSDPYGRISFTWKGVKYYGYLWSGGVEPATNDKQEWTLLSATNNDLTKLIAA